MFFCSGNIIESNTNSEIQKLDMEDIETLRFECLVDFGFEFGPRYDSQL